jgi:manganese/zinc/iron transport system permease protein
MNWDWSLDGWIVATGVLCAVSCALLGNFLVLRKMSMLGDAVSHSILPGLAIAFFVSQSRSSLPMFLGAVIVGVLTAVFTEWIKRIGKVDESASMGVVFTTLFAAGLVMIVQAADKVDLDAGCVLYGAIELTPGDTLGLFGFELPRAFLVLAVVTLLNAVFVLVFYKELKITSFDAAAADAMGISSRWMHYLLMILVAITAVASFESVGNILVVAMMIVPPSTAFLLTRKLGVMIGLSIGIAIASAVMGHLSAITIPRWFGYSSTTTAGSMAACSGALFGLALLFSPDQGVFVQLSRRFAMSLRILTEDIVAFLYRCEERDRHASLDFVTLKNELFAPAWLLRCALWRLRRGGEVQVFGTNISLLEQGKAKARKLVRSHRLWENYLVTESNADLGRIHGQAERLEHFTSREMRDRLDQSMNAPTVDPHGASIPSEESPGNG